MLVISMLPDQLGGVPGTYAAAQAAFNAHLAASWATIADAYVDISADPYIGVATAPTDHPTYWTNGAHLSPTGHAYLATLVKPLLEALLA